MRGEEKTRDRKRRRCLAGAADREVAEANDRQADAAALRLQSQRRHRSVEPGKRTEQTSFSRLPPGGGLAHQSMTPKKPVPDLVPRGNRFSPTVMREFYDACCSSRRRTR